MPGLLLLALCVCGCVHHAAAAGRPQEKPLPSISASIKGPLDCLGTNTTEACDAYASCSWCESTKSVGTGCYPTQVAKILPEKYFTCDKVPPNATKPAAAAPALVADSPTDCMSYNKSKACHKADGCTWCTANGMGTCYPDVAAKFLPKMIFKCDKKKDDAVVAPAAKAADVPSLCLSNTAPKACKKADGCTWCTANGMGTCYPDVAAKLLPQMIFKCDKDKEDKDALAVVVTAIPATTSAAAKPSPFDCVGQNTSSACNKYEACSWCTTSGLGTGCYPTKVAKILPEKFFTCDKSLAVKEEATCDKRPKDECTAPECSWCTSAAVGAACYTPDQAKRLPAAVFKCMLAAA